MRIALLFVLACSSSPKPEPATPTEPEAPIETKPMPVEAPPEATPEATPVAPPEPLADTDLETTKKPKGGQPQIAWQSNTDGLALVKDKKYGDASAKFRDAVARVPDAAYFYNLCHSLYQEGKYGEALTACDAVGKNEPSPALAAKTERMTVRIKDTAKAQKIEIR